MADGAEPMPQSIARFRSQDFWLPGSHRVATEIVDIVPTPITVIIVNYNAGKHLAECVQRTFDSTHPVSVVVVDNDSADNSVPLLTAALGTDGRLKIIFNKKNLGFAKANNIAMRRVCTEYLALLNPDCFVKPDTFTRLRAVMDAHPEVGMAGCMVRNLDGTEQEGTRRAVPTPWRALVRVLHLNMLFPNHSKLSDFVLKDQPLPREPVYVEGISGALMFVRAAALKDVGLMDEGYFLHCEDLDWFIRFRNMGWKILFVPDAQADHVKGACSAHYPVRVLWYKHRGMVRYYRKFFRKQYPLPLMWAVISAVWVRFVILTVPVALRRLVEVVGDRSFAAKRTWTL